MEKKIIFWVISLSLVAIALAILLPGGRKADPNPKLPWDIHITQQDEVQVFGLTLNKSSLKDARDLFQNQGELNLFISDNGEPSLEAYFERVFLSGLRADIILSLKADKDLLNQMVERGARISRTSDITHKIELSSDDQPLAAHLPVELINYIPAAHLHDTLILSLFGEPSDKITETETGVTHWIYPEKGLSIGLNPDGKELIQYMPQNRIGPLIEQIKNKNDAFSAKSEEG
jgi:hypothetical protein